MGSLPLLPEVARADVVLVRRRVLGGPGDHQVSGQISIGRSEVMRLRPDSAGVDEELARMLARDDEKYHYHLVLLSCTFRTGSAPVVSARLSVALRRDHGDGVADAVVWSMDPLRASTPVIHRRTLHIGSNAKLVPEIVRLERGREFTADLHHIVAEGEGESQVEWVFTKTKAVDLVGVHHLTLVARTSTRVPCHADLALAATRRETRYGLVSYRAEIPPRIATIRLSEP